ncbi:indolepyruvate ferredoxin oxidoreductase [bacterium]|nr:indolepyruvate ferredoxin oxidoreductase [candidate division CSSED10-310 bacterium]
MQQLLLLGNEAVGMGALHAGLSAVFGYPGTPSTEVFEFVEKLAPKYGVRAVWSANEKVAFEEALGMSHAGKRSMVTMKHVGLNVAADPFMNSAMTGVNGGLVVAVADDPGMHSSQNEQDSRYYADFARLPCFEPSSQQEAYDMMRSIFEVSETMDVPVMLRLVTRLSHSRANITPNTDILDQNPLNPSNDWKKWVLLPPNARIRNRLLIEKQRDLVNLSERSPYNSLDLKEGAKLGIISTGIATNYVMENVADLEQPVNLLKISQYPIPEHLIKEIVRASDELLVVEEGYPFVESKMLGIFGIPGKTVRGKLSGDIPATGEMNCDFVRKALGLAPFSKLNFDPGVLPGRPPMLCKGCPHADAFKALKKAAESIPGTKMFSDIGCYTLGVLPPYLCGETCVDMGASVSMAYGSASAGVYPVVAIIGDSTFIHSGMTPLIGAAKHDADITVMIMDNSFVAMTGAQETMTTGQPLIDLIERLGVDRSHIVPFNPLPRHHNENVNLIRRELEHHGTSVLIPQRVCVKAAKR